MPMWFKFDLSFFFPFYSSESFLMTQASCCGDSWPLPPSSFSLICPAVAPYVTPANMWVRPRSNELVSYESQSISRAKKFISLVLCAPLGTMDTHILTHTHTHTHTHTQVRWRVNGKCNECFRASFKDKNWKSNLPVGFIETTELHQVSL